MQRRVTEIQRRKAAQEAYTRRVKEGKVDNTYLNFDDWYDRYAITDVLFLSLLAEIESDNSSTDYPSDDSSSYDSSSFDDNSSSYESNSYDSSSDSSSYDSGSDFGGGSDSSY